MKKLVLIFTFLITIQFGYSQVGINTTAPSAQLDIKSSNQATPANNDGILIPKIDAFPVTNPTAAQNSMMVYLTTTSAGKLPGFYYWDNATTSWKGFNQNADADFYKVGTTTPPNLITDDMFHVGNVGIGINVPTEKLQIDGGNIKVGNDFSSWISAADNRFVKFGDGNYVTIGEETADDFLSFKAKNFLFNPSDPSYSGNVGINETAPKAKLHINASNQMTPANTDGIIIPKIDAFPITNPTAAQNSMMVYLTTTSIGKQPGFYYWDNATTSWKGVGTGTSNSWSLTGNSGTNPTTNFIGTIDDNDILIKRNNITSGIISIGNTSFGNETLKNNITFGNTAFGDRALFANTSGGYNSGFGWLTLYSNTTGSQNAAFGSEVLSANTIGNNNTGIGYRCLQSNNLGSDNTAIGNAALLHNTTANKNFALGARALGNQIYNNGGIAYDTNNIAIGFESLYTNNPTSVTNGINNIAVGNSSLKANTTGYGNTAIGNEALFSNTIGAYNVANGTQALFKNTSGFGNVAIGRGALKENTIGYNNVAYGDSSLYENTSGLYNVAVGGYNLGGNGSFNIAIGYESMRDNIAGEQNTAIGFQSMKGINNGNYNTSMGMQSLLFNLNGNYNSAYGWYSLKKINGSYNTGLGVNAMTNATTGDFNTVVGTNSLLSNSGSNNNTTLGYATLQNNISGSGNIAIGNQAGLNETGSNKLYIENSNSTTPLIYGDFATDLARINGDLRVNSTTVTGEDLQIKNSSLFIHGQDPNINFGAGLSSNFMISTQDSSSNNETSGVFGNTNNVTIWSPGNGNRLLRIVDEDFWADGNGNPYDLAAEKAYIDGSGQYFQVSDQNKKENIMKIENASEKVGQISGYTYQFKLAPDEVEKGNKAIKSSGVLAQELEKVLPEAVQKNEFDEYFVDYAAITPLLIEALKEQNIKIKALETANSEILKRLEKLENN